MEKENLFLDVDGCILDFHCAYYPILEAAGLILDDNDLKQWDILKSRGYSRREVYKFVVKSWESDLFDKLPFIKGAKLFLEWAVTRFKIVYITTIPEQFHEKRLINLNNLGILEDIGADVRFARSHKDKARIVTEYGQGLAFIDDKPKNVSTVKKDCTNTLSIWYNHDGLMKIYDFDPKPDYETHSWPKVKSLLKVFGN
jgi:hypothetical protein